MTEKYINYKIDHRTYGGEITPFDFDGHHTMSSMAIKVAKDLAFDKYCQKFSVNKNKKTK